MFSFDFHVFVLYFSIFNRYSRNIDREHFRSIILGPKNTITDHHHHHNHHRNSLSFFLCLFFSFSRRAPLSIQFLFWVLKMCCKCLLFNINGTVCCRTFLDECKLQYNFSRRNDFMMKINRNFSQTHAPICSSMTLIRKREFRDVIGSNERYRKHGSDRPFEGRLKCTRSRLNIC